ncbi:MAG: tyrosine--tRNA ligase [Chloroflexi bacterium]|nr:tyrosine--tRNA ligase [Chloroflexota bacterium]
MVSAPDLDFLLKRGVAEIIDETELRRLLQTGAPLRLKMGFDPSRPDLTLGHVVGLRKLRQFQQLGHKVVLIVGDWTAQIGDPSGQSITRGMLTADEVRNNAMTYLRQFFKVVDEEQTEVRWQSSWFGPFTLGDVIKLTSRFTVAQMLQREDFARRYQEGRPIAITEFLYPLLQAYDSVEVEADVEFGGTDQKFNLLVGRELQSMMGQRPQQVFMVPLLVGTDGRVKMSKSLGNYIAVEDPPADMYGKVMSLADHVIITYFELLTDVPDTELAEMRSGLEDGSIHPMALKQRLAREIVQQFHTAEAAAAAEEHFRRVFQDRDIPEDAPVVHVADLPAECVLQRNGDVLVLDIVAVLAHYGLAKSKTDARRLLSAGAVEANGRKLTEQVATLERSSALKVGKRRFLRIVE